MFGIYNAHPVGIGDVFGFKLRTSINTYAEIAVSVNTNTTVANPGHTCAPIDVTVAPDPAVSAFLAYPNDAIAVFAITVYSRPPRPVAILTPRTPLLALEDVVPYTPSPEALSPPTPTPSALPLCSPKTP
jgi:hypothetical protein